MSSSGEEWGVTNLQTVVSRLLSEGGVYMSE